MVYVRGEGPSPARIMLVGECPGEAEEREGRPFCGASGYELDSWLHSSGILRHECFVTNVLRFHPPRNNLSTYATTSKGLGRKKGFVEEDGMWVSSTVLEHIEHLKLEIQEVNPNVIVPIGNFALWALTGNLGIESWQGSELPCTLVNRDDGTPYKAIPILHPAYILRGQFKYRPSSIEYLRRVKRESASPILYERKCNFLIRPDYDTVLEFLDTLHLRLDVEKVKVAADIETRWRKFIACIGLATNVTDALCIPFMSIESKSYWSFEQEFQIVKLLKDILTHPNCLVIGQNWAYDAQYIAKYWGFQVNLFMDTMLTQHALWPGLPKGLDYLASIYCDHYRWWKGEGKEWKKGLDEDLLWHYNCLDCVYTYEVAQCLEKLQHNMPRKRDMSEQVAFLHEVHHPTMRMMLRGVKRDEEHRRQAVKDVEELLKSRKEFFQKVLGHPLNPNSTKEMHDLFYEELNQQPILHPKTRRPTLSADALDRLAKKEPILKPLIDVIKEFRSMRTIKGTFMESTLDTDGRMRCSFNQAGAETFRFSSSESVFGSGGNLQNIPRPDKLVGEESEEAARLRKIVRRLFQPDTGYVLMEWDLDRADLQVVVWEADDAELKQALRENVDIHLENAKTLGLTRLQAKHVVHALNYGVTPRSMAYKFGMTVRKGEQIHKRWFDAHPGILSWHKRVGKSLQETRSVTNAFGYTRQYFAPIDGLLKEALAWVPQSTVGITINHCLVNLHKTLPEFEPLLQIHDSIVGQVKEEHWPGILPQIQKATQVIIPYPDPLIIPLTCKWSRESWGDAKEWKEN